MPMTTREMFARMIKCEAGGEGEDGMKAVASVITNRANVDYGEFARVSQGGNFRRVMSQPGQFTCMMETVGGQYNPQNIYNMDPEEIHYEVADWAIANNTLNAVGESLYYFNPFKPDCPAYFPVNRTGVIYNHIHQHCFYTPTQKYAST